MTTIDQLTQDLATAQAEIARLLGHIENIYHYNDECSEPSGYVEFQCDEALSQSSPSLQEYRDKVIEECAVLCAELSTHSQTITEEDPIFCANAIRELKSC